MLRKTPSKITSWEEGQELIKAHDCLFGVASELKETKPEWSKELRAMALRIGTIFNEHKSHGFMLRDETESTSIAEKMG